jgi:hypothetical protein
MFLPINWKAAFGFQLILPVGDAVLKYIAGGRTTPRAAIDVLSDSFRLIPLDRCCRELAKLHLFVKFLQEPNGSRIFKKKNFQLA